MRYQENRLNKTKNQRQDNKSYGISIENDETIIKSMKCQQKPWHIDKIDEMTIKIYKKVNKNKEMAMRTQGI